MKIYTSFTNAPLGFSPALPQIIHDQALTLTDNAFGRKSRPNNPNINGRTLMDMSLPLHLQSVIENVKMIPIMPRGSLCLIDYEHWKFSGPGSTHQTDLVDWADGRIEPMDWLSEAWRRRFIAVHSATLALAKAFAPQYRWGFFNVPRVNDVQTEEGRAAIAWASVVCQDADVIVPECYPGNSPTLREYLILIEHRVTAAWTVAGTLAGTLNRVVPFLIPWKRDDQVRVRLPQEWIEQALLRLSDLGIKEVVVWDAAGTETTQSLARKMHAVVIAPSVATVFEDPRDGDGDIDNDELNRNEEEPDAAL